MRPGVDYNAERSAAHTPSHKAQRLLLAEAAGCELHDESWDVPGAYERGPADPNYRHVMAQPTRSDGTQRHAGNVAVMDHVINGTGDAKRLWVDYRDAKLQEWRWKF